MATTLYSLALSMDSKAITSRIEEVYLAAGSYSWLREFWRNFEQQVQRYVTAHGGKDFSPETVKAVFGYMPEQRFDFLNLHHHPDRPNATLKRVAYNNAPHMTETELRSYFTSIGTGQSDLVRIDNPLGDRHAGARESALPWNKAGLVVVSFHPEHLPNGAKVWIHHDSATDIYGVRNLPNGEFFGDLEERDIVTPADVEDDFGLNWLDVIKSIPSIATRGGVLFAFLGDDIYEDDLLGVDRAKNLKPGIREPEEGSGAVSFLVNSVARTSGKVSVMYKVGSEDSTNRSVRTLSNGSPIACDTRTVIGLDRWTSTGSDHAPIPGIQEGVWFSENGRLRIDWALLPEGLEKRTGSKFYPASGRGYVTIRYRDDLHEFRSYATPADRFEVWGVPESSVYNRLRLVLTPVADPDTLPDGWHVRQNPSRSGITNANGTEIDWRTFGEEFTDNMPEPISQALEAATPDGQQDKNLAKQVLERLQIRQNARDTTATGDINTSDTGGTNGSGDPITGSSGSGRRGSRCRSNSNPGGNNSGNTPGSGSNPHQGDGPSGTGTNKSKKTKRHEGLPDARWLTTEEWEQEYPGDETIFVRLTHNPEGYVLRFNQGHALYQEQVAYFQTWKKDRKRARKIQRITDAKLEEHIKNAYWIDSASRVWSAVHHQKDTTLLNTMREDKMLLTIGADGYQNVDRTVKSLIKGEVLD